MRIHTLETFSLTTHNFDIKDMVPLVKLIFYTLVHYFELISIKI